MTAAAQLEVAGSGRSAPSDGHLNPHRNEGGKSAKPAAVLPPNVCNFRLTEVRNFRLTLTVAALGQLRFGPAASADFHCTWKNLGLFPFPGPAADRRGTRPTTASGSYR